MAIKSLDELETSVDQTTMDYICMALVKGGMRRFSSGNFLKTGATFWDLNLLQFCRLCTIEKRERYINFNIFSSLP